MAPRPSRAPIDLEGRFQSAIQSYWATRAKQQKKQKNHGGTGDAGLRPAAAGDTQMTKLEVLISDMLCEAGLLRESIQIRVASELPGYFRAEKKWDLVVVADGQLIAAVELKSQAGPSFGTYFNHCAEKAIGNATDIWTAHREGRMSKREGFQPLLGYFFLLEDCPEVHRPTSNKETNFPTDPAFKNASYCKRYELLCKRLVQERLFNVACLTLSKNARPFSVKHPTPDLSFEVFASAIKGQAAMWLALTKAAKKN